MAGSVGKKQLTREQALSARALRNPDLEATRDEKGVVSVTIPRRDTWWIRMMARISSVPKKRIVTLDEVGTEVWDLCDGEHETGEIIRDFAVRHQLSRKEAEVSVVTYLRDLARRGMIILVVPESSSEEVRSDVRVGEEGQA